jgi:hypothetical protein
MIETLSIICSLQAYYSRAYPQIFLKSQKITSFPRRQESDQNYQPEFMDPRFRGDDNGFNPIFSFACFAPVCVPCACLCALLRLCAFAVSLTFSAPSAPLR